MKTKKRKKYATGTPILGYMEDPGTELQKNKINLAKAAYEGNSDPLALALNSLAALTAQIGPSIAGSIDGKNTTSSSTKTTAPNADTGIGEEGNFTPELFYNDFNPTYLALGGQVPNIPVEIEGGEVGETPDGQIFEAKGPSHEQGGIDINLPEMTEMFSKRIKIDGESIADRKKKRTKKEKTLKDLLEKNGTDALLKNTASRTKKNNQKEEDFDKNIQQIVTQLMSKNSPKQSVEKHSYGDVVGPLRKLPFGKHHVGEKNYFGKSQIGGFDYSLMAPILAFKTLLQQGATNAVPESPNTNALPNSAESLSWFSNLDNSLPSEKNTKIPLNTAYSNALPPETPKVGVPAPATTIARDPSGELPITPMSSIPINVTNKSTEDSSTLPFNEDIYNNVGSKNAESNDIFNNITVGDGVGMLGDLISTFGPYLNTLKDRSQDTPNINPYENYGKRGLETLDKTKGYVNQVRDQELKDLELGRNAAISRGRNSARGVNTMRALDLATDENVNNAKNKIYSSFADQMMKILTAQSQLENQQDAMVGKGALIQDTANRQDTDTYYANLAQNIANMGKGIQTLGGRLNQAKSGKDDLELINKMKESGTDSNQFRIFLELLNKMQGLNYNTAAPTKKSTTKKAKQ